MLSLGQVVEHYAQLASKFGDPVALADFGLTAEETSKLFSAIDEDYHVSRFLHFSNIAGETYIISGEVVTHVSIAPAVQSIL